MTAARRSEVLARAAASLSGCCLAGLVAAGFDASAVARASQLAFARVYAASGGLIAPLVLALGVSAGVAFAVGLPARPVAAVLRALRPSDARARAERAAVCILAPFFALLFLFVVARWSLPFLGSSLPAARAGAALSLAALLLAATLALSVSALARRAHGAYAIALDPAVCLGLSAFASISIFFAVVLHGAPSGAGGVLSMFGVLTRDELDLRPLGLISLIGLGAFAGALAPRWLAVFCVALLPLELGLFLYAARRGLEAPAVALAIERSAPLAGKMLAPLRRISDRDHDGYSAYFGGGDCDDRRPDVNPGAEDVPGNHIDEDCSGADAVASAAPPAGAAAKPNLGASADAEAWARAHLQQPLNVVLLTIDTLRYDLGYAGNPRPLSPRLDELAKESVVFDHAYALASYTAKSLPPMLIGRYASETHRGYSHFNRFDKADTFVAERLARAHVHTLSVQGHWYFFESYGMERGFDRVNSEAAPRAAQAAEGDRSTTSDRLSDAVLRELAQPELTKAPFFLWAHYTDPHAEYVVHPGFEFGNGSRAAYDSEVAFVDHHIGRVLDALRASPLWANTAVIVTSDHGEAFGEHSMIRHGFELWEELVHVPLLVRVPGASAHHVSVPRSAIDLVPTILDLFESAPLDVPSGSLSGTSLLADVMNPPGYRPEARPILVDMPEGPNNQERRAFVSGDKKLVLSGGRVIGLYDLARDPLEKKDLSSDGALVAPLLEQFRSFRRTLREVYVRPTR